MSVDKLALRKVNEVIRKLGPGKTINLMTLSQEIKQNCGCVRGEDIMEAVNKLIRQGEITVTELAVNDDLEYDSAGTTLKKNK